MLACGGRMTWRAGGAKAHARLQLARLVLAKGRARATVWWQMQGGAPPGAAGRWWWLVQVVVGGHPRVTTTYHYYYHLPWLLG